MYTVQVLGADVALKITDNFAMALNYRTRWQAKLGKKYTVIVLDNTTGEILEGI